MNSNISITIRINFSFKNITVNPCIIYRFLFSFFKTDQTRKESRVQRVQGAEGKSGNMENGC
jgi:hypothetical protein